MVGETRLSALLKSLSPKLVEGIFVFATLPDRNIPEALQPVMVFEEPEGTTIIVRKSEADASGVSYIFPCRMITLAVHSSLEAVGMIARIAAELTKHGISTNSVSGYFHDHLFVPYGREQDTLEILKHLSESQN